MGVNDLWQILEPVKQHVHLRNLCGKTIAVDLSLWVCEAQSVKKMMGTVVKPHLRNLFFRVSYLMQMDIKLVFVMEGEPPNLKADVMNKRNHMRYGASGKTWSQKTGRSHFKSVLRECLEMLECLGIPWVQAAGEAEAMCAYLNIGGHVDGCLTNDGDAFLYGAQTVYRNFTMNAKDPHVDCYTMSSIKNKLGLDRDALVGLAILLGCDYLPKGVPGVGKEQALKLIQILKGKSLLQRFNQWNEKSCHSIPQPQVAKLAHCSVCSHPGSLKDHEHNGCQLCKSNRYCEPHDYEYCCPCEWHQTEHDRQLNGVENNIKKKACSCEGFPFHEVIEEFLLNKDKLVGVIRYQRPDLLLFQRFTLEKMEWPNHYACEKLLVLLTHYDMIERKLGRRNSNQLQPIRIVKPRIRNGVHCFEVEWEMPEHFAIEDEELILTVEEESLFEAAYPKIVAIYKKQNLETKGKKQKHMKIKPKEDSFPKSDDAAVDLQSLVTLKPTPENFPKQDSKLNLEISSDPVLPQKTISGSLTSLLLPQDVSCLNMQEELMSSSRPLLSQHSKDASNSLSLKSGQPNPSLHDTSVITDLHLSSIDWEGTSFSNYPAIQGSATFNDLQSEFESKLLVTPGNFENTPGQLLCESGWCTANINKLSEGHLQKISPEKHLLSGISDLYLQDLPLKERIYMKSSYPEDNAQSDVDLKTLPLQKIKESYIANSRSDCPSHLSKDLPGINLLNESRNSEVTKRDQLPQENCKVNTSVLYSVNSSKIVKTSSVQAGPPNNSSGHSRKVDMHTIQKRVKKNSVCLHRHSSDAESSPVFDKVKNTTQKIKHSSQEHNLAQFKESDHNKQRNPTIHAKETTLSVKSYRTTGNEEKHFSDPAKSSMSFLQCHKKDDDLGTCLDSPLPLCQRLKLRFQST
ncbi:flap endonuclease GEN homolog 1 isoform X1 [Fukomys damarensis]|uniref:flap endonuclease GEN homolog 1 isoform X1 n=1 Tax=Fukomys damarensis TaxID=885580 RepID=UPI00053FCAD5|nr:flap endonuclease GEN homolog 1 isoform X1 [Fukomys damarensis]XP_010605755.1 flap endonuclease GEN homolog 1 isoform X1 [Fukomys damarensis]XP_010605756.1 flap endonuclease GEN homolog 1 isoform X1 [Fukomys damarensis]XP_019060586.1 flap endonuclease GEN homolog 1 isoform X1 [Fukomys damarensis]